MTNGESKKGAEKDDLGHELRVATELARRAGAMLLDEFHRPGGPRGDGREHAEVDDEVEDLLRAEFARQFPEDGFKGEESASRGLNCASRSGRTWVVDPNDGTNAFLKGRRGSALSIALVREGKPVLGVVFAPAAPDDAGDLFTWAEGQPFRRNGVEVARESLPSRLGPHHVVLASASADEEVESNARAVAPARFLAMPSIAYRLALVAAGDAAATFSLNGVSDWDVAGGQALLRAVGGVVLSMDGTEFEQDPESYFASNVFAGHPGVAADLLARDARPSIADSPDAPDREVELQVVLHVPRRQDLVRDPGVLSRAHGALLGQVVGDALGQMVEFESEESVRSKYPGGLREMRDGGTWNTIAGQPTDDSEMALALARSILRANGYDPEVVRTAYGEWLDSGPFDVGSTTIAGIKGAPLVHSKSNGSLMRVSPLAVHGAYRNRDALVRDARADSRLTHPNATCIDAVAAFCVAIAHAIRTGEGPAEVYAATAAWVRSQPSFAPEVAEVFAGSDVEAPARLDGGQDQGYVVHALRNAFHQLLAPRSFEEALVATVSRGGDTDTNGAIAGALLGAVHGRDAIPARWRAAVLSCRPMPETSRPRPTTYWPVDVLHLAEALVSAGQVGAADRS